MREYFGAVAAVAELVRSQLPSSGPKGLVLAIVVTAVLFDPVRKWIQERMDQFFYRARYDYRKTLIEFGRELSSETDLDKMLGAVVDRLSRTLLVDRIAIFLCSAESDQTMVLAKSFGISQTSGLDFGFLTRPRPEMEAGHLFFDNTHMVPRETPRAQDTIAKLELNYYIPCRAQQHPIAFLGLGKTMDGDFLSSEDVELLETLAGYLGIAVQNARLYASLEQKAAQYERLKDFNENIVESINVGVLAVDLEDKIESWNSQMEAMYALPRWQALTRPLSDVFPDLFMDEFCRVRDTPGIHNLYKFRLHTPAGEDRVVNVDCSVSHEEVQRSWAPDHHGRHHGAHGARSATYSGGQTILDWPAGRRCSPRSQHAPCRYFVLCPDALKAVAGRPAKRSPDGKDHATDFPSL